jgi:hypothetical protein
LIQQSYALDTSWTVCAPGTDRANRDNTQQFPTQ